MGVCKRNLDKAIIPLLFGSVLYNQLRPESNARIYTGDEQKFPSKGQPITQNYYADKDIKNLLFRFKYVPAWCLPGVVSLDFVMVNEIEISGPDITDELVDRAVAEYQEVYQTPMERPRAG